MKYTKKYIRETLRTLDQTKVFRLYVMMHPEARQFDAYHLRREVADFIKEYAPTVKVARWGNDVRWFNRYRYCQVPYYGGYTSPRHDVIKWMEFNLQILGSPYCKRPLMGNKHLWSCSPVFGHSDYNKSILLPVKGNEHFCEAVVAYWEKKTSGRYSFGEDNVGEN